MEKNVTIVIPVYSDWASLDVCIQSLKKYVSSDHKVMFINDRGPEGEELERNILAAIAGAPNYEYYKNDQNLGFVKTCNRAVFELDKSGNDVLLLNSDTEVTEGFLEELQEVLYAAEKHGAVCPRSCQSDILTIPVHNELGRNVTPEESYRTWQTVKDYLPRQQMIPTGAGFALLIKRSIIDQYGLFDEDYSPGYNEENDFCHRINQYGFNIMMANHAFVYHYESKSFGTRRQKLDEDHRDILKSRYPYFSKGIQYYFEREIDSADYFADMIVPGLYEHPRVLISLYEIPGAYNGTAQHGLSFLKAFYNNYKDKYDISILINNSANEFYKVSNQYPNVILPHQLTQRFHIAYSPSQIISIEHMHMLNNAALKIAFCMQDIISIRSRYLLLDDWEREDVFRKSIRYCDGILPCSDFSMEDTKDYYKQEFERRNIYTRTVYEAETVTMNGSAKDQERSGNKKTEQIPYNKFFLVLGNHYKHKYLDVILPYLRTLHYNFIVLSGVTDTKSDPNICQYKSGTLSSEYMDSLFRNCTAVIFPSVYEGFGLPIYNAIKYNKRIILNNNPLNREQLEEIPYYEQNIYSFDSVQQIGSYLDDIASHPDPVITGTPVNRTWDDEAKDIEEGLQDIMNLPLDINNLRDRWNELKYEERIHRKYMKGRKRLQSGSDKFFQSHAGIHFAIFMRQHFPRFYAHAKDLKDRIKYI